MKGRYLIFVLLFSLGGALAWFSMQASARAGILSGTAPADGTENVPPGATIQTLLTGMDEPADMAFDPNGRLFYTERVNGAVRLFANGVLQASPVVTFEVDSDFERGLLGIAVDPNFNSNHFLYAYYTCAVGPDCPSQENRVVRFVESNGLGSNPTTIFSSPQSSGQHNGGNLSFGPDGKLYISVGDGGFAVNSQDVTVPNGKLHRINSDGSIPPDNPVFTQTGALPSLYAMGLRNSFDFDFDPLFPGRIFASENGPGCDDELNRIEGAYNYGWRDNYPCDDANPDSQYNTLPPLWYIPENSCCKAPTGLVFYRGWQVPQWTNGLFMATYNTREMYHFYLDPTHTHVTQANIVQGTQATLALENGPDGALWYIEAGAYNPGILHRIVGPGTQPSPTATATQEATTPTATGTPIVTPSATPTITLTPDPATSLVGHVSWEGRPAQPDARQQWPITLTLKSVTTEVNYPAQTTNASGYFTVSIASLAPGTYNWRAKGPRYLAIGGGLVLGAAGTTVEMGTLRAGDSDEDDVVSAFDFNILARTYGKTIGDPGYDPRADYNGDEVVDAVDFNLLKRNFGTAGYDPLRPSR